MNNELFKKLIASLAIMLMCSGISVWAQNHSLRGTVVDNGGLPVIGASVIVEGTTQGVVTAEDGTYRFESISPDAVVVVSCMGFVDQSRKVGNASVINFTLQEDSQMLDELVVVGYGIQKRSDLTAAVSSVKSEAIENRSVETVQQALQGKVSGVQVYAGSGAPGEDPQIRVRGFSSNSTGASNPLYVVDGLKVSSIGYLDPSMIESIEVLKDAASASIYGAEAGNGVVLITTKSGGKGAAKSSIFYNFSYGFTSLGKKPDLMNAEQYIAYQTASGNGTAMSAYDGYTDNDWFETLYGDGGHIQRHTVGFEGGNDKGTIYTALSYLDNDGMYYGDKDYMNRITMQVNATYNVKPWLDFTTNNSLEYANYSRNSDQGWGSPYLYDPLTPAFYPADKLTSFMQSLITLNGDDVFMKNENGDYVAVPEFIRDSANPLTNYYRHNGAHKNFRVRGTTAVNFKPVKGLTITSRLGYYMSTDNSRAESVPCYYSVSSATKPSYSSRISDYFSYDWENFANFVRSFGKHDVNAMVGMSYHRGWSNYVSGSTDALKGEGDNFHYLDYSDSAANDTVGGIVGENANLSYFGRLGYSYDDRYGIQVSFRADGYDSSKLASESRWGYFPSVAGRWTISNEPWMKDVSKAALSYLKIRASYGENGNVNVLSGYPYASSLETGAYYPMGPGNDLSVAIKPSDVLANPSLRWEVSKQVDLGIDARFLNDRLSFTMDWYNKNTTGQLIKMTAPTSSGATTVTRNVGLINNNGFEFDLGWKDTAGDFFYSISANLATLNNKVVDMGGNSRIDGGGNSMVWFDVNQPVWSFYGYRYDGFDPQTGDAIYFNKDGSKDENGKPTIDEKDKVYLGSAIPDVTYGITVNLAWKGIDFTLFGSGSAGGELLLNARNTPQSNRHSAMWTDSWSVKGASATYPRPAVLTDNFMYQSSMLMYDGSYFKIKQIALGYSLPEKWLKKIFVSKLRVYASLDNFFCFTKYPGMDPETINASSGMGVDLGDYPTPKSFSIGVNLSF